MKRFFGRRILQGVACGLVVMSLAGVTHGQGSGDGANPWVERASAAVAVTPGTEDIAGVLMPALAGMSEPPVDLDSVDAAMLISPKNPGWSSAVSWAKGGAQGAALTALEKVTDPKKKFLLALPYGSKGVDPSWVKAGLTVELPRDGLLAGAKFRYLGGLERLVMLVNVEATRLAEEGKADQAMTLLVRWVRLAKTVTERETAAERRWAMTQMSLAFERMRDMAYVYREKMTSEICRNTSDDIDARLTQIMRIRLPVVEKLACEQLIERTIREKGDVDAGKFAATMSRLKVGDRPLTLFSEAAWWRELAGGHAGWFDTRDQLKKVFGGWENRWAVENLHDKLLEIPSDYAKMDKGRFALIDFCTKEIEGMQDQRLRLLVDAEGTRISLGIVGYERTHKVWPPNVTAVQPKFVRVVADDPYFYDERYKRLYPFHFKVPIRDDPKREREDPKPHEMTVGLAGGGESAGEGGGEESPAPEPADPALKDKLTPVFALLSASSLIGAKNHPLMDRDLESADALARFLAQESRLFWDQFKAQNPADELAKKTQDNIRASGATADQLAELTLGMLNKFTMNDADQAELGLDFNALREAVVSLARELDSIPESRSAYEAARSGTLTGAMVVAGIEARVAATGRSEHLVKVAQQLLKMFHGPQSAGVKAVFEVGRVTGGGSSMTVTVTERDFLLWSVGPDRKNDDCERVGVDGSDVLIWPPVLSLRRAHSG